MKKSRIYVASPLSPIEGEVLVNNMSSARLYCSIISINTSWRALAPHSYLPFFLDDSCEEERKLALQFGLDLISICDCIAVCGNRISPGMKGEILHAATIGIPVYVADENLIEEVSLLCKDYDNQVSLLDCDDSRLAMCSSELFC